jgi:hypothetical protein
MSDKIENCTMNRNWIWNGREYMDIITWNAALEDAALTAEKYEANMIAYEIRMRKKK